MGRGEGERGLMWNEELLLQACIAFTEKE